MTIYQIWEKRYIGLGNYEEISLGDFVSEPFVKAEAEYMREQGRNVRVRVYEVTEQPRFIEIEDMHGYTKE